MPYQMLTRRRKLQFFPAAFIFLCMVVTTASGQFANLQNQLHFKKINVKDGLSQASVNCFYEDIYGFMWIGTDDGLNRFDGVNFTVYRSDAGGNSGLSSSQVWAMEGDPEGNISKKQTNCALHRFRDQ